jgi:glyoxylase-like metal-dependent hydrolase (beta-lactamase superfamily II)
MNQLSPEVLTGGPRVVMFTAPNPGPKTLSGTHAFVIGNERAYVVDPGPANPSYQRSLATWLSGAVRRVDGVLLTHGHPDHAPGAALLAALTGAHVWASERMTEPRQAGAGVDRLYSPDESFVVDGDELRIVLSPGHSPDHVAFWMPGARILFAGDTILGQGTTLIAPPEGDMVQYMETLERFRALNARVIAPGHGPVIHDPDAKIEEYIEHRRQREAQIVAALEDGPTRIPDLVARIYRDVDPSLHGLAAESVNAQLEKLVREGRVQAAGDVFALVENGT